MAIVTFKSNELKETGQTLSIAAVATQMAIEHNRKILVVSTNFKDQTLENCFWEVGKTVNEVLIGKIATIGENMTIRRFVRFESTGLVEKYIHGEGKIGVLVELENGDTELAKDICMQIAAAKPEFLDRESVPAERVEKEMKILKAQAMNEGKPAEIAEKMVQGRLGKFYGEFCLVEQDFVKNPDMKIKQLLESKGAKIIRFARFEKGEGIEKKEENFAEEVAKQIKG